MATESKSKTETCNMVFLAGILKFDPKVYDKNVRALIDVGMKSAIQVSVYSEGEGGRELGEKLKRFREGDFIKVVAALRPYGVKQDDNTWKNNMSIDITEIKTEPPARKREERRSDDDVPF